MDVASFRAMMAELTKAIGGLSLDTALEAELNHRFPAAGEVFQQINAACQAGVANGWLCQREAAGIRFGRVFKPDEDLQGFSVDVVHMKDVVGPHHVHPNGEIDLIMPLNPEAKFDGCGAGWMVYSAGSAHCPTVTDGEALVLYLLPQGAIQFTG